MARRTNKVKTRRTDVGSKHRVSIIVKRMEFARDLLGAFGVKLFGFDPGVTGFIKGNPEARGSGYWGEPIDFTRIQWEWLVPLLVELRERRKLDNFDITHYFIKCDNCGNMNRNKLGVPNPKIKCEACKQEIDHGGVHR